MRLPASLAVCAVTIGATLTAIAQDQVLETIVIEGNTKTDRDVIERVMGVEPGASWDLETLDRVWDRLEDCGYFAFVDLDDPADAQGRVTLYVSVEEEKTFRATPYLRYDRRHKYLLGGAFEDTNLRGQGETLAGQFIAAYIQRAHLNWERPWLAGMSGLSLALDAGWEQGPFVFRPFDYQQWQLLATLRKDLGRGFYMEFGGGFESFEQQDPYTWPRDGTAQTFGAETRDAWQIRALGGLDTRDSPHYPTGGMFHTLEWLYRDIGDAGQNGLAVDLRVFQQLFGSPILALRAHGRTMDEAGAVEYLMRWGGPETVRGAPYAGREGDTAYLLTAEVRYPLALMRVSQAGEALGVGVHGFVDMGDAWIEGERDFVDGRTRGGSPNRAWQSFGAGVHLNLLTWQLRFEAAKERDHDWAFQFMDVFNF